MHTHSSSQLCLHTQFDVMSAKAVYGCDSEFTPLRRHLFFGVRSRTTFSRIQKGARKREKRKNRAWNSSFPVKEKAEKWPKKEEPGFGGPDLNLVG